MTRPRAVRCREWMQEHDITFPALAAQLGMKSDAGPRMLITRETIPVKRYNQLRALGFPEDILPIPLDLPRGPRPKEPRFPGLMGTSQEAPLHLEAQQ